MNLVLFIALNMLFVLLSTFCLQTVCIDPTGVPLHSGAYKVHTLFTDWIYVDEGIISTASQPLKLVTHYCYPLYFRNILSTALGFSLGSNSIVKYS